MPLFIAASGYHHPPDRLTNADLAQMVNTTDEWIRAHTGIIERRRAADDVNTSDLGVIATRNALKQAGWRPEDVDLMICTTSTPDYLVPSTASWICNKLGLDGAVTFDLNSACSGVIYSLSVAQGLMETRDFKRVAVCAADKYTRITDYTDRRHCIFFGDGAATLLLQPDEPSSGAELVDIVMTARNDCAPLVTIPVDGYFEMDAPQVKEIATRGLVDGAREVLKRNGLGPEDVTVFLAHQVNMVLLEALAGELGIDPERHWHNVQMRGNQGAAGIATTLGQGLEANAAGLRDGDFLLLTVYGGGFTGAAALLRWTERVPSKTDAKPQRSSAPTVA
jgi:3-oxoacyl-[acyl-carrier-protein] synthase-3